MEERLHRKYKRRKTDADRLLTKVELKSGNRDDILDWLYKSYFVASYTRKLEYENHSIEDYIQEMWIIIAEIPLEKWDILYAQGESSILAFVSGIIYRLIKSANSPLWTKYKKRYKKEVHVSEETWLIYDETGKMPETLDF